MTIQSIHHDKTTTLSFSNHFSQPETPEPHQEPPAVAKPPVSLHVSQDKGEALAPVGGGRLPLVNVWVAELWDGLKGGVFPLEGAILLGECSTDGTRWDGIKKQKEKHEEGN